MIFPALVFSGLQNNDCCGCCGNRSCGKRFAVSERKHDKKSKSEIGTDMCIFLSQTEADERGHPALPFVWVLGNGNSENSENCIMPLVFYHRYHNSMASLIFAITRYFQLLWQLKFIAEKASLCFAEYNSPLLSHFLLAAFKITLAVRHCIPNSLQAHKMSCISLDLPKFQEGIDLGKSCNPTCYFKQCGWGSTLNF